MGIHSSGIARNDVSQAITFVASMAAILLATVAVHNAAAQASSEQAAVIQIAGEKFESTSAAKYLSNAVSLYEDAAIVPAPGLDKQLALRLYNDNQMSAEFNPVPVSDTQSYQLDLRSLWKHDETLLNNPAMHVMLQKSTPAATRVLPNVTLVFMDNENKVISEQIHTPLPFGQWHTTRFIFYPPTNATQLVLKASSGQNDGALYLQPPKLKRIEQKTDDVVLSFKQASADINTLVYGWSSDANLRLANDGSLLIDTGYGSRSDMIPLSKPGKYRLSVKGQRTVSHYHSFVVKCFDKDNKVLATVPANTILDKPEEFILPPDSTHVQLFIYSHLLDEVRFEKIND